MYSILPVVVVSCEVINLFQNVAELVTVLIVLDLSEKLN
jgi:hypothetical protein